MNEPACGYSVWVSGIYKNWYPLHKFLSYTDAQREAERWRRTGGFAEVRYNQSLVW